MHERNTLAPFPIKEMEKPYTRLEKLLVKMGENRMPDFKHLPTSILSTSTEACANWYYALTSKDPELYERGDIAHVKKPESKLIYSKNPTFGPDECEFKPSKRKDEYDTTLDIHSHKNNSCFSGYNGDLDTLISGWGKGRNHVTLKAMVVACPDYNYLMLKTNETREEKDRWKIYESIYTVLNLNEFLYSIHKSNLEKNNRKDYGKAYKTAEKKFFSNDINTFFRSFIDAYDVAENFRLGFYFSKKDGNYTKFTKQRLRDHISLQIKNALNKSESDKISGRGKRT